MMAVWMAYYLVEMSVVWKALDLVAYLVGMLVYSKDANMAAYLA